MEIDREETPVGTDTVSIAIGRGAEKSGISHSPSQPGQHPEGNEEPNGHDTWGLLTEKDKEGQPRFRNRAQ